MEKDDYIYMEDCRVGQVFTGGPLDVTQDDIIKFARDYDPQPFHLDPVAAKETVFEGLAASGWHTAALTMKMIVAAIPPMKGGMIGRRIEHIDWPRPVRPGDTLRYEGEIIEIIPSAKNPARGTLRIKNRTLNQHGKAVMEMETLVLIPRREDRGAATP